MADWSGLRERIVLWEDDFALVVNKPPGLSVMGERHDTDLVTMAADAGELLWWVNRIDKVTSGAVVLAKTQKSHGALTRQFVKQTVAKAYLAICQPGHFPDRGTIDLPLLTAGSGRIRVAAERQHIEHDPAVGTWYVKAANLLARKNYPSRTDFVNLWDDDQHVVVLAMPVTGRRHQIRVHLAWVGHAIVGDPLFSKKTDAPTPRTHLHSLRIAFETAAPRPQRVEVEAKPGTDFWEPVVRGLAPRSPDELLDAADAILKGNSRRDRRLPVSG
ncbi:RNA pseudouridine synthase [Frankia sp. Cr1]|uniref:pseudouridine synthase family protein n=1 Tax=Frankia sp. Cr1 TaxID=3073931 RepID=UPI002AD5233B|nr:RNA pseudouridine synthase [Frankia sp. Cr1]